MKALITAIGFLTRIPVSKRLEVDGKGLARSMAYFPLVGFLLGLILAAVNSALAFILPEHLINVIVILVLTLLTGGMHLDGFADTVDGFCAKTVKKEEILNIMRDSRIGAMGVIGLIMLLLLKYEALNSIPAQFKNSALILMCSISRWGQVMVSRFCGYARKEDGLGKSFVGNVGKLEFYFATILTASISLLLYFPKAVILLVFASIAAWMMMRYVNKRIGGMTGDTIGAISELLEIGVLLCMCLLRG